MPVTLTGHMLILGQSTNPGSEICLGEAFSYKRGKQCGTLFLLGADS
jgi:hypothetical protein